MSRLNQESRWLQPREYVNSTLIELYNGQCKALNDAALAWHKRLCEKEGEC